jgi:branched-chain amino acid transport system substrate-binding protein
MNRLAATSIALAAFLVAPWAAAEDATKSPILVGAVSSLTGPGASDVGVQAARAYFDSINAAGGVHGRRIEYRVIDDQMSPKRAQEAATLLIEDPRVVALAGGSSVLECAVNHERYAEAKLLDLPGGGIDPACFSSTHIAPLNAGPYVAMATALSFVQDVLRRERICVVSPSLPGMTEAFERTVAEWARKRGITAPRLDLYELGAPLAPLVQRVAQSSCGAVVYTGPEGPAIEWVLASRAAGLDMPVVTLTAAYTTQVAKALQGAGDDIYTMAEFDPWSSSSLQMLDWRRMLVARQIEPSSLSQGGYLSALALVRVMLRMQVPITRASVTQALQTMPPWNSGMTNKPFKVGANGQHQLNRSALAMKLEAGRWRIAHAQWIND